MVRIIVHEDVAALLHVLPQIEHLGTPGATARLTPARLGIGRV
jgi:hypothetical protein